MKDIQMGQQHPRTARLAVPHLISRKGFEGKSKNLAISPAPR